MPHCGGHNTPTPVLAPRANTQAQGGCRGPRRRPPGLPCLRWLDQLFMADERQAEFVILAQMMPLSARQQRRCGSLDATTATTAVVVGGNPGASLMQRHSQVPC